MAADAAAAAAQPRTGARHSLAQYGSAHLPLPSVPAQQKAPRRERGHRPRT